MTAQLHDKVLVGEESEPYVLVGVAGEPLFQPEAHGLAPKAFSTACWRGWHASYHLVGGHLTLHTLGIGLGDLPPTAAADAPTLQGRAPHKRTYRAHVSEKGVWVEREYDTPEWFYEDLSIPVPFTGGMLIGRGFLRELYVHMGFHPAWKHEHVLELLLDEGRLTLLRDVSPQMAELRRELAGHDRPDPKASRADLTKWIEGTFSLSYPGIGD